MGHIWLIGLMGSGKNAVGSVLAERAGLPFYDIDERVERIAGRTVSDIFFMDGEETFRTLEADELRVVAENPDGIVATGGGSVLAEGNVATMGDSGTVVLLEVTPETAAARIGDDETRPLLGGDTLEMLSDIFADRAVAYRVAAELVVDGNDDVETVADRVESACAM
ncbi:MAG: shikimate kinase [Acidimicrobiia bacterium]|nr:MAG: shikimate kinase [Acidimicrobiia bacterium]